jgi:hypothetical protein
MSAVVMVVMSGTVKAADVYQLSRFRHLPKVSVHRSSADGRMLLVDMVKNLFRSGVNV